jgi:hypothetical protein
VENLGPTGIRSLDGPGRSESLYRLIYDGLKKSMRITPSGFDLRISRIRGRRNNHLAATCSLITFAMRAGTLCNVPELRGL